MGGGGGRKNLKRTVSSKANSFSLLEGQSVMRVISLRGSNVIEVMDSKGVNFLAFFPAKFQKSIWIKRGSFVVVDSSGIEKALESGCKVSCMVSQVLFHDQVRALQKSSECPEIFKNNVLDDSIAKQQSSSVLSNDQSSSDNEDGGYPLEENLNRNRPAELFSDSEDDELPPLDANLNGVRPLELCSYAD